MGEFNVNKSTGGLNPTAGMPDTYPANNVMMTDGVTSVEEAVDEIKSGLTNIGNDTDLGNVQGSDTITLTDAVTNYRFVQILIGYYGSGYPCYGQALLPVSTIAISAVDLPVDVAFSDIAATKPGRVDISFLTATSVKVVSTSATVYTRIVGIA